MANLLNQLIFDLLRLSLPSEYGRYAAIPLAELDKGPGAGGAGCTVRYLSELVCGAFLPLALMQCMHTLSLLMGNDMHTSRLKSLIAVYYPNYRFVAAFNLSEHPRA